MVPGGEREKQETQGSSVHSKSPEELLLSADQASRLLGGNNDSVSLYVVEPLNNDFTLY